jgi:hypothetical protein
MPAAQRASVRIRTNNPLRGRRHTAKIGKPRLLGSDAMGSYRWYVLDRVDHVKSVETVDCVSDADAMTKAAQILEREPDAIAVEIWNNVRLVGRAPRAQQGAGEP